MAAEQPMNCNRINAVLFDVDDTLFDRRAAFSRWARRYLSEIVGVSDQRMIESTICTAQRADGAGYGSKIELIRSLMCLMPSNDSTYTFDTADREYTEQIRLDSDADEILRYLEQYHIPYGIVTNGGARQSDKVKRLGLTYRCDCVFISGEFGCDKPDPRIFQAASDRIRVEPQHILFVGDHPVNDIWGARQIGMQTAWIPNGQRWPDELRESDPDYVFKSPANLKGVISVSS